MIQFSKTALIPPEAGDGFSLSFQCHQNVAGGGGGGGGAAPPAEPEADEEFLAALSVC